jgi:hypothetical protein
MAEASEKPVSKVNLREIGIADTDGPSPEASRAVEGEGAQESRPPTPQERTRSGRVIGPCGESATFHTNQDGYTILFMINLGPDRSEDDDDPDPEAEIALTWISRLGPQLATMTANRVRGTEHLHYLFHGAKVTVTNLSKHAHVEIRVSPG